VLSLLSLFANPLGRIGGLVLLAVVAASGLYLKGRIEGRAACLAQGERDVLETIERADRARAAAERRDADAGRLRDDDAFRRD
jgi:glucokinase